MKRIRKYRDRWYGGGGGKRRTHWHRRVGLSSGDSLLSNQHRINIDPLNLLCPCSKSVVFHHIRTFAAAAAAASALSPAKQWWRWFLRKGIHNCQLNTIHTRRKYRAVFTHFGFLKRQYYDMISSLLKKKDASQNHHFSGESVSRCLSFLCRIKGHIWDVSILNKTSDLIIEIIELFWLFQALINNETILCIWSIADLIVYLVSR